MAETLLGGRRGHRLSCFYYHTSSASMVDLRTQYRFDFMIVHCECTMEKRKELWRQIDTIITISNSQDWLITGNFNEILQLVEWDGLGQFNHVGASKFNNAIKGLTELKAIGRLYTWCNGVILKHIQTKLDQALKNMNWISGWPQVQSVLLFANSSDHAMLLIELLPVERGTKPFKFYNL